MTNYDAMAEKIITDMDCDSCQSSAKMRKQMTNLVAVALREAVDSQIEFSLKMMKTQIKIAKAEAYEAAAKIAETNYSEDLGPVNECCDQNMSEFKQDIADKIRAIREAK